MEEYQTEYFIIFTQNGATGSEVNGTRSTRFLTEYEYLDNSEIDRKFIAVAGLKDHVLSEAAKSSKYGMPLACILCVKTSNSKHILRALKKVYGPTDEKRTPRINFSGQDMTIFQGTSFDELKTVTTMLGENLAHHDDAFQHYYDTISAIVNSQKIDGQHEKEYRELQKKNQILWRKVKMFQSGNSESSFLALFKKMMTFIYVCLILYFVFLHPGTPEKINGLNSESSRA